MATKSMDLGQVMGTSAYQEAQAGGYTGTKEEFQEALANVGNGGETFVIQADETVSTSGVIIISNVDKTLDEVNAARQAGKAIRLKLVMDSGEYDEFPLLSFAQDSEQFIYKFGGADASTAMEIHLTYEEGYLSVGTIRMEFFGLSDDAPPAPGTASAGTSDYAARADHVHPKEVSATDRAAWNGKASKPKAVSVTLSATGWDSLTNKQTVTVSGVLADTTAQVIWVTFASETALDAYMDAGIVPIAQGENTVTFRANTIPTDSITVSIVMQEVGA